MYSALRSGICSIVVAVLCAGAAPPNDSCDNAIPIQGQGAFAFDNTDATYGGVLPASVWYCWTAPYSGEVTFDTCSKTTVDTFLFMFDGCDCPPSGEMASNDNSCATQARVSATVVAGQQYLIGVGTTFQYPVSGGPGTLYVDYGAGHMWADFTLQCDFDRSWELTPPMCQPLDRWDVSTSDRISAVVTDDFSPAVDDNVSELCWWGTYLNDLGDWGDESIDSFEVRYYDNDRGMPGTLIAGPFSQTAGTLSVNGPVLELGLFRDGRRIYGFSASHDPVPVLAGRCYWLEITNASLYGTTWQWAQAASGDGRSFQDGLSGQPLDGFDVSDVLDRDMAFCPRIDLAPDVDCFAVPVNDDCTGSTRIEEGLTAFDTKGATTDGPMTPIYDPWFEPACWFPLGDKQIHNDIWYDFTAPCGGELRLSLCESVFDTKIAVYRSTDCADPGDPIACNDDACGDDQGFPSVLTVYLVRESELLMRVGGYNGASGRGTLDLEFVHTPPPWADLRTFADFVQCYTGRCYASPCVPALYASACCRSQDYDADGDVDVDDAAGLVDILSGPPMTVLRATETDVAPADSPQRTTQPRQDQMTGTPATGLRPLQP